ncbi:hypothetical protein [Ensifer sesbaniae]|uniref:hypothetical protein n=1 Tax=Ensifer sesbaniae TaxID=1214071 RepID=UPI001FE63600|nr:hypothetical protein [Ensifer sesbaniae]NRQ14602.1 hypothetical protein [Ensifer sesbaniae]
MLVKLKGIHKVKRRLANGEVRVHYYAWRGGPKMEAAPNTEAFAAELLRHRAESAPAEVNTLDDLIDAFQKSPAFAAPAEKTQDAHRHSFKEIRKEWPKLPLKLTQQRGMKAMIRNWHHTFAANPRKADQMLFPSPASSRSGLTRKRSKRTPAPESIDFTPDHARKASGRLS